MASILKTTIMGVLLVMVMAAFGKSEAKADPVTFSTSGTFTCAGCAGSGTNSVTFLGGMGNALMITFTGLGSTSLSTPTGSSFGNFQTFFSGRISTFGDTAGLRAMGSEHPLEEDPQGMSDQVSVELYPRLSKIGSQIHRFDRGTQQL